MAGVDVIADMGDTLVTLLVGGLTGVVEPARVMVATPDDFKPLQDPAKPAVTVFLYQIAINPEMRNSPRRTFPDGRTTRPLLPVDLHYLVTPWAKNTKDEFRIIGRVLQTMYDHAELGPADLQGTSWQRGDSVQLILEHLSLEEQFNIWDPTELPYRLSLSYMTRVIGIEPGDFRSDAPVVTASFREPP
jgi:hypothetical protein